MGRLWIFAVSLALAACQSAGTGSGNVRGTSKPVAFTWQSIDAGTGDMTATFGTGRVFKGRYVQITDDVSGDSLVPLWDGWADASGRGHWRYWERNPGARFFEANKGRVLANLHASDGEHMRCRFTLNSPSRGMAGGGDGRCQLSESTQEINARFARQS